MLIVFCYSPRYDANGYTGKGLLRPTDMTVDEAARMFANANDGRIWFIGTIDTNI